MDGLKNRNEKNFELTHMYDWLELDGHVCYSPSSNALQEDKK